MYWAKGQADSVQHGKTYGCVACGAASSISRSNNWGTTISVSATFGLSVEVVSASLTAGISRSTGGSVTHTCSKNDLPRRRGIHHLHSHHQLSVNTSGHGGASEVGAAVVGREILQEKLEVCSARGKSTGADVLV